MARLQRRTWGGPGARSCPWKDGYIMSDLRRDHKGVQWSVCSLNQFAYFANDRRSSCMHNRASAPANLPSAKKMPGKLMTVDAQCKRDRGSSACLQGPPGVRRALLLRAVQRLPACRTGRRLRAPPAAEACTASTASVWPTASTTSCRSCRCSCYVHGRVRWRGPATSQVPDTLCCCIAS